MTSRTKATIRAVLLFPVCILFLTLVIQLARVIFLANSPTGTAYLKNVVADSSIAGLLFLGVMVASAFIQQYYMRWSTLRAGTTILVLYGIFIITNIVMCLITHEYYVLFVGSVIRIGTVIGLGIGYEAGRKALEQLAIKKVLIEESAE